MAVLVEGMTVIIREDVLLAKFPGGWDAFELIAPTQSLCADTELVGVGFMAPQDVDSFIEKLQSVGLEFLRDNKAIDMAVVTQMGGITPGCDWLELGNVTIHDNQRICVCRIVGSQRMSANTPPTWKFEGSLSSSFGFVSSEDIDRSLKFLRHEKDCDVYFNMMTGKEVYVRRM